MEGVGTKRSRARHPVSSGSPHCPCRDHLQPGGGGGRGGEEAGEGQHQLAGVRYCSLHAAVYVYNMFVCMCTRVCIYANMVAIYGLYCANDVDHLHQFIC